MLEVEKQVETTQNISDKRNIETFQYFIIFAVLVILCEGTNVDTLFRNNVGCQVLKNSKYCEISKKFETHFLQLPIFQSI